MSDLSLPTARSDWRRIGRDVGTVLSQPRWLSLALLGALLTTTLFVAATTPVYVQTVVLGGDLSLAERVEAALAVFPLVGTAGVPTSEALLYVLAGVAGTNLAVLGHHLSHDRVRLAGSTGSVVGVLLGTLGAGCAACGVVVAAGVLTALGVTAGLAALPWEGTELLVLAIGVNVLSLHWLVDGGRARDVDGCPVDP